MPKILAIDAGGTTTRAAIVDASGQCLGYGRAGPGNLTSAGPDLALTSLVRAAQMAFDSAAGPKTTVSSTTISLAGASGEVSERAGKLLSPLGLTGDVHIEGDVLGTFFSGTFQPQGYALVVGTGAVAARIKDGHLDRVADGAGWLLGDVGSGYWIGHQVTRAAVAALDGRGPKTALTNLLLSSLELRSTPQHVDGRSAGLLQLMKTLYALRPVELSKFAPLAFQAGEDEVAINILRDAAVALAATLTAVHDHSVVDGPIVLGGSVLGAGMLNGSASWADPLKEVLKEAELLPVRDGVVGAAVLGLLRAGIQVDAGIFARVGESICRLQDGVSTAEE